MTSIAPLPFPSTPVPGPATAERPSTGATILAGGAATLAGSITGGLAGTKLAEARGIRSAPIALSIAGGVAAGAAARYLMTRETTDGAIGASQAVARDAGGAVFGGALGAGAGAAALGAIGAGFGAVRGGIGIVPAAIGGALAGSTLGGIAGVIGGGVLAHRTLD